MTVLVESIPAASCKRSSCKPSSTTTETGSLVKGQFELAIKPMGGPRVHACVRARACMCVSMGFATFKQ